MLIRVIFVESKRKKKLFIFLIFDEIRFFFLRMGDEIEGMLIDEIKKNLERVEVHLADERRLLFDGVI
jgi:hypothetical protein